MVIQFGANLWYTVILNTVYSYYLWQQTPGERYLCWPFWSIGELRTFVEIRKAWEMKTLETAWPTYKCGALT